MLFAWLRKIRRGWTIKLLSITNQNKTKRWSQNNSFDMPISFSHLCKNKAVPSLKNNGKRELNNRCRWPHTACFDYNADTCLFCQRGDTSGLKQSKTDSGEYTQHVYRCDIHVMAVQSLCVPSGQIQLMEDLKIREKVYFYTHFNHVFFLIKSNIRMGMSHSNIRLSSRIFEYSNIRCHP